ncbi:hypothetical protein GCM10012275_44870 [Longimycelium tulufanense]|uniref:Uncharacterized protein n=1 Tax=Longimycelium tulufanense TaxID=907463 RepID=A0A8J3CBE3_9PSEU|nr:hypothetical protein [Longimycelium tulufanense]GGM69469.1 hypothetical protein GCM10012275_44870 [Longimycelium tulufanense]
MAIANSSGGAARRILSLVAASTLAGIAIGAISAAGVWADLGARLGLVHHAHGMAPIVERTVDTSGFAPAASHSCPTGSTAAQVGVLPPEANAGRQTVADAQRAGLALCPGRVVRDVEEEWPKIDQLIERARDRGTSMVKLPVQGLRDAGDSVVDVLSQQAAHLRELINAWRG